MPPTTKTMKTMPGEPTFLTMLEGTIKMALPITVPTTMAAALQMPSSRFSSGWLWVSDGVVAITRLLDRLLEQPRDGVASGERGAGSDQNIPGEGDVRPEFNGDHDGQAGEHSGDGGVFLDGGSQQAEQEDAQEGAVEDGRDGESGFQDRAPVAGDQAHGDQNRPPGDGGGARDGEEVALRLRRIA